MPQPYPGPEPGKQVDRVTTVSGRVSATLDAAIAGVSKCSWVPCERFRRRPDYVALGLEHGAGPKVARRRSELGCPSFPSTPKRSPTRRTAAHRPAKDSTRVVNRPDVEHR